MVRRIAIPIVAAFQLATCGAFCQSVQAALPDAPSVAMTAEKGRVAASQSSILKAAWAGMNSSASLPARPTLVFEAPRTEHESGTFLKKYLETPFARQETRYQASSKDSLLGRATDAAARIFVTRDETGRRRVNTSYVVGVLTSVAAHNASRPYWARSNPNPIGDIGSTVGNDAGMNLMHEFGPGLRQAVAGHMPSFVFRVERRIVRTVNPTPPLAGPR
jgi:hypothetical protein